MSSASVKQWIASACFFIVFGAATIYFEVGNSPSLANVLSGLAVLGLLLGLALSPQTLFGVVTRKPDSAPSSSPDKSGNNGFSPFPRPLRFGLLAFAFFFIASVAARHV